MKESSEVAKPEIFRQQGDPGITEKPHNRFIKVIIYIRTALVCSAITLILGTLVMTGWVTGTYYLASLGLSSIPMAPSTSLAFILLGGSWFFHLRAPSSRLTRVSVLTSALFVLLLALLNLIQFFTGVNMGIEEFLVRRVLVIGPNIYGSGPMSPLTAFNFVLTCSAMLLLLTAARRMGGLSGGFASVITSVNLVVLLGYLYGTPLLYGGEIRPVALHTGITFLFLNMGLIATIGPNHFPLRLLVGPSLRSLLLRSFLLVISFFALTHALIEKLFSRLIVNAALETALALLISVVATGAVVLRLSRTIGSTIEREETGRKRADEALSKAYDELEIRIQERTAELAKTNETLQAEITKRRRSDEEIKKERDKAQKYLDIAGVMIVAIDVDQKITLVNKKCSEVLGYGEQEIISKNWFDTFIPERVRYEVKAVFEKLIAGKIESVESVENPVLTRRGEERLIAWHNTILRDEAGDIAGTLSSGEDITEQKGAEKRLSLLASIVDSSDDAIIGKTLDGIIVSWNRGAQRIYGYSADEVKGHSISILVPPDHPDEFPQLLERIRQGQRIEHHETIRMSKDGKKICSSLTISPIKDANGKIIGASTIAWDITEQKRIEIALRESEARFRSITQSATDAIISADSDDNIISWNKSAQTIFGYTEEEALGKSLIMIIPEIYRDAHKKGLERVNSTGETRIIGKTVELVGMRKDGSEFPLELSLSTWKTGIRRLYSAVIRDITESKQANEKLKQTLAELERSNKDLEQFAYAASHDLQEPLRTVSNFSQLLAKRYKGELDAKADQFIGFIVDGATRMQEMIDNLLAYSRVSTRAKPFELINCETVFDQALANVKMAIEESGALVTHDHLPTVMADASQLVQLLQNLLSNAIKFRKEKPRIKVSSVQRGNEWLFSVEDNGIGIATEFMEHIFKVFQREHASAEYPGTGVGLAICKKIVERHGGRIWVESQVGKGSTFYFTIPVRKGEKERT
ncbi:two-component system, NarL family, sensor histidine kinase EvgS [Methanosarcinales archaeon]|nr:two-component system, NarL family, sensor histidine kinase EvgS [Methanosarcinales archaeon]